MELQIGLRERGPARCPYCRDDVQERDDTIACPGCKAVLHRECAEELPRCPIHGCRERLVVRAPQRTRRRLSNAPANQPSLFEVLGIESDDTRRTALIAGGIVLPMILIGGCFSAFDDSARRKKLARAREAAQHQRQRQLQRQRQAEARRQAEEERAHARRLASYEPVRPGRARVRPSPGFRFETETEGTPGLLFLREVRVSEPRQLELEPGVIATIGRERYVIRERSSVRLDPGHGRTLQVDALSLDLARWRQGSSERGTELRPANRSDEVEQRAADFVASLEERAVRADWLAIQVALLIVAHDPTPDGLFGDATPSLRRAGLRGARSVLQQLGRAPEDFRAFGASRVPPELLSRFTPPPERLAGLPRHGAFVPLAPYRGVEEVRRLLGRYAALPLWPSQTAELAQLLRAGGGLPAPAAELRRRLAAAQTLSEAWVLLDSLLLRGDQQGIAGALEWAEDGLAEPLLELLRGRLRDAAAGLSPNQLVRAARRKRLVPLSSSFGPQQRAFRARRLAQLCADLKPWRASAPGQARSERSLELLAFHFPRERRTHVALFELARSEDAEASAAAARGLAHLLAGGGALSLAPRDLLEGGARPAPEAFRLALLRALSEEAPARLADWIPPLVGAGEVSQALARGVTSALVKHPEGLSALSGEQLVQLLAADPVAVRLLRHLPPEQAAAALLRPALRPLSKPVLSRLAYDNPRALSLLWGEPLEERERLASLEAIEPHGPRSRSFQLLVERLARRWAESTEAAEQRRLDLLASWSWRVEGGESAPLSEVISEALSHPEAERRAHAAHLNLSKATQERLLPLLRRRLEFDPEPRVRRQLLLNLSMNKVKGCDRVAQRWLAGEDRELRRAAAWAMSLYPWLGAEQHLLGLLDDEDPEVRRSASLYKTRRGEN